MFIYVISFHINWVVFTTHFFVDKNIIMCYNNSMRVDKINKTKWYNRLDNFTTKVASKIYHTCVKTAKHIDNHSTRYMNLLLGTMFLGWLMLLGHVIHTKIKDREIAKQRLKAYIAYQNYVNNKHRLDINA